MKKWYKIHPYAKKLNENWICGDYRIDQQRPQRKVYSDVYLKIINITEIERKTLDKIIYNIEKNIEYPTVWDDGVYQYYEDTIHCPKCGKRRKVLTSHSHCEFCGFEFKKAKKCPECKDLSLNESQYCNHCGYDYVNNKSKIKHNKKDIRCSECKTINKGDNKYCISCGHKLQNISKTDKEYKKYCTYCGKQVRKGEDYCQCGKKIKKRIHKENVCPVCGQWNEKEDNYCWNCNHNKQRIAQQFKIMSRKKCPNCKTYYDNEFHYCEECGTKLINKHRRVKNGRDIVQRVN